MSISVNPTRQSLRTIAFGMVMFLSILACSSGNIETLESTETRLSTDKPTVLTNTPHATVDHGNIRGSQEYRIRQEIRISNDGPGDVGQVDLWVSLASSREPFQSITSVSIDPNEYSLNTDDDGNEYIHIIHDQIVVGDSLVVTIEYQVVINEVKFNLDECTGKLPGYYLNPEPFIESNEQSIRLLADQLVGGKESICQQMRAIYDYVAGEMTYAGYNPGDIGALEASKRMSGDCSEFSDLLVALSRSAGIPARNVEGVTCCSTAADYDEAKIKHSWVEVYLPSTGWTPMDPTWGRDPASRDQYFAALTADHFAVSTGRNLSYLDGYHYYYFTYSYPDDQPDVTHQENWSIINQ
jgi:transglutaminase-like putative cysteine protease